MSAAPPSKPNPDANGEGAAASATASELACSRCDGPVNPDDLVEGLAVRIDGLTVCALCIETLSPALRIQINRVRALKGLAAVTYRVALKKFPQHQFYSFTSAGLLLLHRRALVHGSEFATPDLPANHQPSAPNHGPRPATVQIRSTPPASRLPLLIGLGVAGVVMVGGVVLLALGGAAPKRPASGATSAAQATVASTAVLPGTSAPSALVIPALTPPANTSPEQGIDVTHKRELKDYRAQFSDTRDALQAALTDGATPELVSALERDVAYDARTKVDNISRVLRQTTLGKRDLDEVDAALIRAMPPDRPAFTELRQALADLGEISQNKRGLVPVAVVPEVVVPVTVAPTPENPATIVIPETVPDTNDLPTKPKRPEKIIQPKITLWSGELGPKSAVFTDLTDVTSRIPSPWPFFIDAVRPRFAAAVKSRAGGYHLQLSFPIEQVANGGIYLTLHRKSQIRKDLVLTRIDLPTAAPQKITFSNESWQGFTYRVEGISSEPLVVQISDSNNSLGDPFWLGATAAISNGEPNLLAEQLSSSPLRTPDPLVNWTAILEALKYAANGRGHPQKWFNAKFLTTSAIKILGPDTLKVEKLNDALRERREMPDVKDQIEVVDPCDLKEIKKLLVPKANPGLFNQTPLPTAVFFVTNGGEITWDQNDWAKHVRAANELLKSNDKKPSSTGFVPVWVIGRLDGAPMSTQAWNKLRGVNGVFLIDLTSTVADGSESPQAASRDTYHYLAEGISTLMYQLQLVQHAQRSR